jgi:hypothetical protein
MAGLEHTYVLVIVVVGRCFPKGQRGVGPLLHLTCGRDLNHIVTTLEQGHVTYIKPPPMWARSLSSLRRSIFPYGA